MRRIAIAVSAALALVLAARTAVTLWDVLRPKPHLDDPAIVRARAAGRARLAAQADAFDLDLLAPIFGPSRALFSKVDDRCSVGEHSWTVSNEFDLFCEASATRVRTAGTVTSWRGHALALDERLRAAGWSVNDNIWPPGLSYIVERHWDRFTRRPPRKRPDVNHDGHFGPADMIFVTYTGPGPTSLVISWTEPGGDDPLDRDAEKLASSKLRPGSCAIVLRFRRTTIDK
ncbi:MAG: hypothetical protein ABR520_08260 [Mycobacteriales bacterium]